MERSFLAFALTLTAVKAFLTPFGARRVQGNVCQGGHGERRRGEGGAAAATGGVRRRLLLGIHVSTARRTFGQARRRTAVMTTADNQQERPAEGEEEKDLEGDEEDDEEDDEEYDEDEEDELDQIDQLKALRNIFSEFESGEDDMQMTDDGKFVDSDVQEIMDSLTVQQSGEDLEITTKREKDAVTFKGFDESSSSRAVRSKEKPAFDQDEDDDEGAMREMFQARTQMLAGALGDYHGGSWVGMVERCSFYSNGQDGEKPGPTVPKIYSTATFVTSELEEGKSPLLYTMKMKWPMDDYASEEYPLGFESVVEGDDLTLGMDIQSGTYSADHKGLTLGGVKGDGRSIEHTVMMNNQNRVRAFFVYNTEDYLDKVVLLDETKKMDTTEAAGGGESSGVVPQDGGEANGGGVSRASCSIATLTEGKWTGEGLVMNPRTGLSVMLDANLTYSFLTDPMDKRRKELHRTTSMKSRTYGEGEGEGEGGEKKEDGEEGGDENTSSIEEGRIDMDAGMLDVVNFEGGRQVMVMLPGGCYIIAPRKFEQGGDVSRRTEFGCVYEENKKRKLRRVSRLYNPDGTLQTVTWNSFDLERDGQGSGPMRLAPTMSKSPNRD